MIGPVVENEIFPRFHLVDNIEYYKNLQDRDWMW